MKFWRMLLVLGLAGCSSPPTPPSANRQWIQPESRSAAEKIGYAPKSLPEQTFVFSAPLSYTSTRSATSDDVKVALKRAERVNGGNHRFLAVPVESSRGNTTVAEVMVYDASKSNVASDTVYQLSNTPAPGQALELGKISAIYAAP